MPYHIRLIGRNVFFLIILVCCIVLMGGGPPCSAQSSSGAPGSIGVINGAAGSIAVGGDQSSGVISGGGAQIIAPLGDKAGGTEGQAGAMELSEEIAPAESGEELKAEEPAPEEKDAEEKDAEEASKKEEEKESPEDLEGDSDLKKTKSGIINRSIIEESYRLQYSPVLAEQLSNLQAGFEGRVLVERQLVQYGYGTFSSDNLKASQRVIVSDDFILGPGDRLRVNMWGAGPTFQFESTIAADGTITFPQVLGVVPVAGIRYGDIQNVISDEVSKYVQGVNVRVTVVEPRSLEIYVVGQVRSPGLMMAPAFSTVLDALALAGGPIKVGSLRKISIFRAGKLLKELDLYDILLKGDAENDVILEDKDVIHVPYIGPTAAVVGSVLRPGIFELKNENTGLDKVLALAGGALAQSGVTIAVKRFIKTADKGQKDDFGLWGGKIIDVVSANQDDNLSGVKIKDGDLVEILFVQDRFAPKVSLIGEVWNAQNILYQPGMTLSTLIPGPEVLKPDAYTKEVVIHRFDPKKVQFIDIVAPLDEVLAGKPGIKLMPRDVVLVRTDVIQREFPYDVKLTGHVWQPLTLTYQEGMTLTDLIPGPEVLKPNALTKEVIIHRFDPEKVQFIDLAAPLEEVWAGKPSIELKPRDVIEVKADVVHRDFPDDVTLTGHIWQPLTLTYSKGMLITDLVTGPEILKPGAITDFCFLKRYLPAETQYRTIRVPLALVLTGKYNINLQPHDRIIILSEEEFGRKQIVELRGAVWKPGSYDYMNDLSVADLIALGGGTKQGADLSRVEISRQRIVNDETKVEHFLVDISRGGLGMILQPFDSIRIPRVKGVGDIETVRISGEIRFPGAYTLKSGEKLSDLIIRAGGFLPDAYLFGAKFFSQHAKAIQQAGINRMIDELEFRVAGAAASAASAVVQTGEGSTDAAAAQQTAQAAFVSKLRGIEASGRVSISLVDLNTFRNSKFDFELEDGDALHIPKIPSFISVVGSVYSPNSYLFQDDLNVEDYLEMAGGPTKTSDEGYIYVLRANGEVMASTSMSFFDSLMSKRLMPGDVVVVPEDLERVPYLQMIKGVTEVVYNLAVAAGTTKNIVD